MRIGMRMRCSLKAQQLLESKSADNSCEPCSDTEPANYQPPCPEIKWPRAEQVEKEQERDTAWLKAWNKIVWQFNRAECEHDVEQMHKLWNRAAAETSRVATGMDATKSTKRRSRERMQQLRPRAPNMPGKT